jgi:hypothetical protein
MTDLPVACTLSPDAIASRRAGLLPGLVRHALRAEEFENGVRYQFAASAWPQIAATVEAERRCCRFLQFELRLEPDEGPITLTLTGPRGTRVFLAALIAS